MQYEEPDDYKEETYQGNKPIISDNTAFMRWSTEVEIADQVVDKSYMNRNRHRIIDINKFLPLSNIKNPKMLQLLHLRRINMDLAADAGLDDIAECTALDNLADYNTTRGIGGFYQKALITQRKEWKDGNLQEKQGFLKSLIKGKQQEEQAEHLMDGE